MTERDQILNEIEALVAKLRNGESKPKLRRWIVEECPDTHQGWIWDTVADKSGVVGVQRIHEVKPITREQVRQRFELRGSVYEIPVMMNILSELGIEVEE